MHNYSQTSRAGTPALGCACGLLDLWSDPTFKLISNFHTSGSGVGGECGGMSIASLASHPTCWASRARKRCGIVQLDAVTPANTSSSRHLKTGLSLSLAFWVCFSIFQFRHADAYLVPQSLLLFVIQNINHRIRIFWGERDPQGSSNPALEWIAHMGIECTMVVLLALSSDQQRQ